MALFKNKNETKEMRKQHKALIEQWSRPIYNKSADYHDLALAQSQAAEANFVPKSVQAVHAQQKAESRDRQERAKSQVASRPEDLISGKGFKGNGTGIGERVSVPFSKGFQFTIRPANKVDEATNQIMASKKVKKGGVMEKLNKSMIEKNRPLVKNERSLNMSVAGRGSKDN